MTVPATKEDPQGPLWTPTVAVERMMRECEATDAAAMVISREVLKGLLFDTLYWRRERSAPEIKRLRAVLQEIAGGGWNDVIEPVTLARAALEPKS